MECKQCGKEIDDEAKFCNYCGYNLNSEIPKVYRKDYKRFKTHMAVLFSALTMIILLAGILANIFQENIDNIVFYGMLFVSCIINIINVKKNSRILQVIRGVLMILVFELFIIANMDFINQAIDNYHRLQGMRNILTILWFLATLLWLVVTAVKVIVLPKSKTLGFLESLTVIIAGIISGVIVLDILQYNISNIMYIKIEIVDFIWKIQVFILFIFYMLSNLFVSWKESEEYDNC